jgi:hypothetical protein
LASKNKNEPGMRNPKITLAYDEHRNCGVVSLRHKQCNLRAQLKRKSNGFQAYVAEQKSNNFTNPLDDII